MTNTSVTFDVILRVQASIFSLVVILPLCVYVLHLGFKQWKSKKHDPSWFVNYSDFFAYNVAVMELVGCAGYFALLFIIFYDYEKSMVFYELGSFAWYGQFLFPVFTVLEHYVAVVHPMTYVSLKKGRGILIRNICSGLVWVISSVLFYIATQTGFEVGFYILDVCQMVVFLGTIFYCNMAVLKVLLNPKPGDAPLDKGKVDKSKQLAFFVIGTIFLVLCLKFSFNLLLGIFWGFVKGGKFHATVYSAISYWVNVLTSLLLPLLYLQRTGKIKPCWRRLRQPG
ncbi:unnamed protein product [Knipowitschia caucasica]